ncbi:MAG: leucine-rich repeat protein [Lachnospiraceae bacterium]|nr:leucine-rich repeat protein [Lachnospiraceae bacterium]
MRGKVKRIGCMLLALIVWIAGLQVPAMDVKASEDDWEYSTQSIGTFVAYGNGTFVSVADSGKVWVSQNGYTWKQKGRIATESRIGGLDYCGEYFFVYGSMGEVYLSRDGSKWSQVSIGRGCILKIVYGEGRYVANAGLYDIISGSMGEYDGFGIYESDNGINWRFSESTINNKIMDIAYGNGCFVAVGEGGTICTKGKGDSWEKQSVGEIALKGIAYGNGVFMAVTKYAGVFTSVDGVTWKQETGCYGEKIVYYNSCFYVWNPSLYYGNCLYVKDCRDIHSGEWIYELEGMKYNQLMDIACGNGKVLITTNEGVFVREDVESPEARLSYLNIKQGNLDCEFQPDKTFYRAVVSESFDRIDLSAKAMESQALISIKGPDQVSKRLINGGSISLGLEEGDTVFEITVLAEDKMETETYFLTVVRRPQYEISVKEAVGGYATGAAFVEEGGSVVLAAVPKEGFRFVCWKEGNREIARSSELTLNDIQTDREISPVFEPIPDHRICFVPKEASAARGEELLLKLDTTEEEEGYHRYTYKLLNGSNSAVKELWYEEGYTIQVTVGEKEAEDTLYVQCYEYNYNNANVREDDCSICTAVISVIKEQKTYQITAVSSDEQAGTVTGGGSMTENENMLLTAKANPGYYFVEWQENGTCYSREESLILSRITEDKSLTAVFERKKLESVQIVRKPNRLSYKTGEPFDTKGMLVKAVYNDGSWEFVADYDYSPKEALTAGNSYVQIAYEDAGIRKEARVSIKVSDDENPVPDKEDGKQTEDGKEEENQQPGDDKKEENKEPGDDKEEGNKQPGDDKEEENQQPGDDKEEENKQPGDDKEEENQQPGDDKEEGNKQPGDDKKEEDQQPGDDKEEGNKQPEDDKKENNQQPDDDKEDDEWQEDDKRGEGNTTDNYTPDKKAPDTDTGMVQDEKKPETGGGSKKIFIGATIQSGNYKYKVVKIERNGNGQVCLIGAKKALVTVKVPESIKLDGKVFQVTEIGDNAFKNQKKLKKVIIGENVQKIGTKAFYGCRKLTSITIKSKNLHKMGKKVFQGISPKAVIRVPKKKYKKYKKLLKGKGIKSTMKIKKN